MRIFLRVIFSTVAACAAFGQAAGTLPRFEVADIHPARLSAAQVARGPFMSGTRYDLRNASIVDLIVKSYDVTPDRVVEGPNWLEFDRFDVTATIPQKTSAAEAKLMLQSLLRDRFSLAIRKEERPMTVYALIAPKGKQKLKEADGSGDTGCRMSLDQPRPADPSAGPPPLTATYTCHNVTMASFAAQLNTMTLAQQFIGPNPVQDKTGIEGAWEFSFKYTLPLVNTSGDTITLPDALDKQLGLKLEQETMSLPVLVVEKVSQPSPNDPDVAQRVPSFPAEFEVATIKPFAMPAPGAAVGPILLGMRMLPGGRLEVSGLTLKQIMLQAWGLQADAIVGAPKWMDTDRYSIVAKIPGNGPVPAANAPVDPDAIGPMLQALLADRFKLAVHKEDRTMMAYTLTAAKPKLKKADAAERTKWSESNGPISLNGSAPPSRTIKFQNMNMTQFAERLQFIAGTYVHGPVVDGTELSGGYDFSLTFSPIPPEQLATMLARAPNAGGAATAADPIGGVSLVEALDKQLGLKLVEQKRPVPVLVIDHIDEKPADN